ITGGGLTDNVPRALPKGLAPRFDDAALSPPPLFSWLKEAGGLSDADLRRTFNCGVGGVIVARADAVNGIVASLKASGEDAWPIGDVIAA
ncbi:MAG: AIR synthase-related protein, partial [Pseudomonadota bacterium]